MIFNSLIYAIFLPIVFIIYWLLGKNLRLQNAFVVLASYVFYGWWDWRFLILIAITSFCSWGSGLLIAKKNENNTEGHRGGAKRNIRKQNLAYSQYCAELRNPRNFQVL